MKLKSRPYQPGDEVMVNKLYKLLTNRDRSFEEYKWEWLETWDGRGNMYYLFDEDRPKDDQLICQYSLIPTPMSVFGKYVLAGKTENCMSHPDYRGKGIYIPHEKKYFEESKNRFKIFFTTAGNIGAAWAIRLRLGYKALDLWVYYYYYINHKHFALELNRQIKKKLGKLKIFSGLISKFIAFFYQIHSLIFKKYKISKTLDIYDKSNINLNDIETLWEKNKNLYEITVDRNSKYLKWRINENPYYEHYYLCQYENNNLIGYLIFYTDKKNIIRIVDMIADNRDEKIFRNLLENLKKHAVEKNVFSVSFSTLLSNNKLKNIMKKAHFVRNKYFNFKSKSSKKKKIMDFYAYFPENLVEDKSFDPNHWYITDLAKEGR